jgi:hypothetical protein
MIASDGVAQKLATMEVALSQATHGLNMVASVNLDDITFVPESSLSLVAVEGSKRTKIPFQISQGRQRVMYWIVKPEKKAVKIQIFELVKGESPVFESITATGTHGSLDIHVREQNLLSYVYETVFPPAGIDTVFKRSAFIHPLLTPRGQALTRIQAPDHYHHYGIWNPWTHVLFEGDTLDFWNLKSKKGTVRFGNFVSTTSGPVYAGYQALHEHVAFKSNGEKKVALKETQTVHVFRPEKDQSYYIVDLISELNCASESPFKILEYRYAGLGWRATENWNKDNSEVLTSEGKTRKEADGSNARWFLAQGSLGNDYGGALMMSYPSNYNHPEPLRIWPENPDNGLFAMFAPTKNRDWLLQPGKTYTLKYRFVVFNDHFSKEKAESAWQYFAAPPKVTVKLNP